MKSNLTNLLFICNSVVFIVNDLSVHLIIFLIHVPFEVNPGWTPYTCIIRLTDKNGLT